MCLCVCGLLICQYVLCCVIVFVGICALVSQPDMLCCGISLMLLDISAIRSHHGSE